MTQAQKPIFYQIFESPNFVSYESIDNTAKISSVKAHYRRAHRNIPPSPKDTKYTDKFNIDDYFKEIPSVKLQSKPLSALYNTQHLSLFSTGNFQQISVEQKEYPSFITELCAMDRDFAKTIIMTNLMSCGYIEYFVRRQGEYFIQCIDDKIPIDSNTHKPLWGLSMAQPWKLVLMKAWIKEKKGFMGVINAQPLQFIKAFGPPAFKVFKLEKELNFLKTSKLTSDVKRQLLNELTLFRPACVTFGKTRNLNKVQEMGVQRNRAGYIFTHYESDDRINDLVQRNGKKNPLFKVHSEVPHRWIGQYCVGQSQPLLTQYSKQKYALDIKHDFLASYNELVTHFHQFHTYLPYKVVKKDKNYYEDFIRMSNTRKPRVIKIEVLTEGHFNFNIELPSSSKRTNDKGKARFPYIRTFVAQTTDINDQKTENYFIDYIRGFSQSSNSFFHAVPGTYFIYIECTEMKEQILHDFVVHIHTACAMKSFAQYTATPDEINTLARNYFKAYSRESGNCMTIGDRKELNNKQKNLIVYFDNSFERIGFGYISLRNYKDNHQLVMKVDLIKLKESGIILKYSGSFEKSPAQPNCIWFRVGKNQIITTVFQCLDRVGIEQKQFPPLDCFGFFDIETNK